MGHSSLLGVGILSMELNPAVGDGGPQSDEIYCDEDHGQGPITYVYQNEYLPSIRDNVPLLYLPVNYLDPPTNDNDVLTTEAKQIDRTRSNHSFHDIVSSESRRRQSSVNHQGDRVDTVGNVEPVGVFTVTLAMTSSEDVWAAWDLDSPQADPPFSELWLEAGVNFQNKMNPDSKLKGIFDMRMG